jgi:hypothetical protein
LSWHRDASCWQDCRSDWRNGCAKGDRAEFPASASASKNCHFDRSEAEWRNLLFFAEC